MFTNDSLAHNLMLKLFINHKDSGVYLHHYTNSGDSGTVVVTGSVKGIITEIYIKSSKLDYIYYAKRFDSTLWSITPLLDCNSNTFDSFIASVGEHNAGAELSNYVDNRVVHYFNHKFNTLETKVNNASILKVKLNSSSYNGIFTYLYELYRVESQNINKWHAIQRTLGK